MNDFAAFLLFTVYGIWDMVKDWLGAIGVGIVGLFLIYTFFILFIKNEEN